MALIPLPDNIPLDDAQPTLTPLPDHVALDQPNGAPATIDDSVRASTGRIGVLDRVNEILSAPQGAFMANYIPGGKYAMAGTRYLADHITHPVEALNGKAPSFNDEMKGVTGELKSFSDEHPVMSGVMSTAGMLTNPVYNRLAGAVGEAIPAASPTASKLLQTVTKYGRSLLQGGTVGAVTGALNATGPDGGLPTINDAVHDAMWGGGVGAAVGIAAPVIANAGSKLIGAVAQKIGTQAPTMTQAEIKAASQAAYKASEDAGVIVSPESFTDFASKLPGELKGYHPAVTDGTAKIVRMLQDEAANGPLTLEKLDSLRSVASGASINPSNPSEGRLAGNIVDKLDDFIEGLTPGKLVDGSAEDAVPALKEARSLWRTQAKLKTISDIVDTGENLNDANWVKGRFRAIVKNPKVYNRYTEEEKRLINDVARTGTLGKLVRLLPFRGVQMTTQYAEPMMQQSKIDTLQGVIARGANPVAPPQTLFRPNVSNNALNAYSGRSGNLLNSFAEP